MDLKARSTRGMDSVVSLPRDRRDGNPVLHIHAAVTACRGVASFLRNDRGCRSTPRLPAAFLPGTGGAPNMDGACKTIRCRFLQVAEGVRKNASHQGLPEIKPPGVLWFPAGTQLVAGRWRTAPPPECGMKKTRRSRQGSKRLLGSTGKSRARDVFRRFSPAGSAGWKPRRPHPCRYHRLSG